MAGPGPVKESWYSSFGGIKIALFALVASSFVLVVSLLLQWFIYDDWMHQTGPMRIVGTTVAAALTFFFVYRWQCAIRDREAEMLRRFEIIARMNDVIRNALQIIECTTYASDPGTTQHVRQAVGVIDSALEGVVAVTTPTAKAPKKPVSSAAAAARTASQSDGSARP